MPAQPFFFFPLAAGAVIILVFLVGFWIARRLEVRVPVPGDSAAAREQDDGQEVRAVVVAGTAVTDAEGNLYVRYYSPTPGPEGDAANDFGALAGQHVHPPLARGRNRVVTGVVGTHHACEGTVVAGNGANPFDPWTARTEELRVDDLTDYGEAVYIANAASVFVPTTPLAGARRRSSAAET